MAQTKFGDVSYWDLRYESHPGYFEWYLYKYWALRPLITEYFSKEKCTLHAGVGLSTLQDDMARDGYKDILNIDYSSVVIEQLSARPQRPECVYRVEDVRALTSIHDAAMGNIMDKGTLDSLLCGERAFEHVALAVREYARVLAPLGALLVVSYGKPSERMHHLTNPALGWDVRVYAVSKMNIEDAAAAALGVTDPPVTVTIKGPHSDAAGIASLEALEDVHFVYACVKHDLVGDISL